MKKKKKSPSSINRSAVRELPTFLGAPLNVNLNFVQGLHKLIQTAQGERRDNKLSPANTFKPRMQSEDR